MIESLLECVENGGDELGNPFYRSKFQGLYVSANGKISSDEDFESGVVKIQRRIPDLMTEIEKRACKTILVQLANSSENETEQEGQLFVLEVIRSKKQK